MFDSLKAAVSAFLATKFGHALEHAVTAAAATAGGMLINAYLQHGGHLGMSDIRAAWIAFISGVLFFLRTALRNRKVPKERFSPGYKG